MLLSIPHTPAVAPQPIPFSPALPLPLTDCGQTVTISRITGGGAMRQRLYDLGLTVGSRIRVVQNDIPHPLIVSVREDSRLALCRGMAQKILVSPTSS
jgi:Fe2+ transport system protein FeoA